METGWSWHCMECGKRFRTDAAAERAWSNGCPRCGGVDVDMAKTEDVRRTMVKVRRAGGTLGPREEAR